MTESPLRNLEVNPSASAHLGRSAKRGDEHFADESILVHGPPFLPSRRPGYLSPHLFHILQDHIAVAIEGFHPSKQLSVVTT